MSCFAMTCLAVTMDITATFAAETSSTAPSFMDTVDTPEKISPVSAMIRQRQASYCVSSGLFCFKVSAKFLAVLYNEPISIKNTTFL